MVRPRKGRALVQPTIAKVAPWGLPLAHTGYGYGYNNYLGATKYVAANPGSVHLAPLVGHGVNQKSTTKRFRCVNPEGVLLSDGLDAQIQSQRFQIQGLSEPGKR
ncbi:hypothetical protein pipiens_018767 [Culex pipiens pipiens]|uniref:Uncharacterized protein n=1 Tax=Culex pipiens pipiens TaxID=38569 RepID=A0ABD1DY43_CULPP